MSKRNGSAKARFTLRKARTQAMAELDEAEELLFAQLTKPDNQRDIVLIDECARVISGVERELAFIDSQIKNERARLFSLAPSLAAVALCAVCVTVLTSVIISKRSAGGTVLTNDYYASADDALMSNGIKADLPTLLSGEDATFCTAYKYDNGVRLEYLYNDQAAESGYVILNISTAVTGEIAVYGDYINTLNTIALNTEPQREARNCRVAYTYNNTYYTVDTNLPLPTLVKILESVDAIIV